MMSVFRRGKSLPYQNRPTLPIVRRRLPMRYHMRHQFVVRDEGFLQFAEALAERARAGVQVKVILDAVGSAAMSTALVDFMRRNGIDVE